MVLGFLEKGLFSIMLANRFWRRVSGHARHWYCILEWI